jgi:16S rRNA (guanine527-N7)-methyltransferase
LTAPLLRDGGELVLMKGISAEKEIAAADKAIRKFRVTDLRVEVLGEGVLDEATRVVRGFVRAG